MTNEELIAQRKAYLRHVAELPEALARLRNACMDAAVVTFVNLDDLRLVIAEVDRARRAEEQLRKDLREEQREFQREARDIAAEATFRERERHEGGY